ncbi:hypothetical protein CYJ83_09550 [Lactobacillus crispatus]|nr:hypothetical protein CYJ83_09550 [Lactobacillus crispatus]
MFKEINLRNHSSLHKLFYSLHLMIYRIEVFYMKALFLDQKDKTKEIRQDLGVLGYKNFIASWSE